MEAQGVHGSSVQGNLRDMFDAKAHRACSSVQRSCGKRTGCQSLRRRMVQPSWLQVLFQTGDHSGLLLLQAHCQGTEHVLQEKALPGLGRPTVVLRHPSLKKKTLTPKSFTGHTFQGAGNRRHYPSQNASKSSS